MCAMDSDLGGGIDQARYRISLSGNVGATDPDGRHVDVGGPKPRLVLVMLALNPGRVVSAESLIDVLWGEEPPPTARRSLQAHVAKLRAALGGADGPLEPQAPGYILRLEPADVDVLRIEEAISRARSLLKVDPHRAETLVAECRADWLGHPLADLLDHDPIGAERQRLQLLGEELADLELDLLLSTGRHSDAIRELERLVSDQPEHEPHWARLMTGYYRAGRQADALGTYQRARSALIEHLGVEPSLTLQNLEAAVLAQDEELASSTEEACPYKGLASYQVDDGASFYGRTQLIAQLIESIRDSHTCVVVGPSGVGKSSVLRAGLAYRINRGAEPGLHSAVVITPGAQPLRALYQVADQAGVLIIDQFEEIFTLVHDADTRRRFIREALDLTQSARGRLVISVRGDFYGHCSAVPELAPLLTREQVIVPPLSDQDLRDAVTLPAQDAGLDVEPSLVDTIVADATERAGALPLMSHALVETWRRREGTTLTLDAYREAGSIAGAIAGTAERLHDALDAERRQQLERLFLRLVEPGEATADTRRAVTQHELEGVAVDPSLIDQLVSARLLTAGANRIEIAHEALIGAWPRLTSWIANDRDGIRTHRHLSDASLSWEELGRDDAELYRGLRLSGALSWAEDARADLSDLERAFLEASHTLSESELAKQRRTNRRLRVLVGAAAVATVVAVTASVLAIGSANDADRRSEEIETSQLVANLRLANDRGPLDTLRLAAATEERVSTTASRGLLLDSLLAAPVEVETRPFEALVASDTPTTSTGGLLLTLDSLTRGEIREAATLEVLHRNLSPAPLAVVRDGDTILALDASTLEVKDLNTGAVVGQLPPRELRREDVALSPDGALAAIGGTDPSTGNAIVEIIDIASGQVIRTLRDPGGRAATRVQFDATGTSVIAATDDQSVALWELTVPDGDISVEELLADCEGEEECTFAVPAPGPGPLTLRTSIEASLPGSVSSMALSPDGEALAIGRGNSVVEIWRRTVGPPQEVDGFFASGDDDFAATWTDQEVIWDRLDLATIHSSPIVWVEFDAEGEQLVSSGRSGSIVVWDAISGTVHRGPFSVDSGAVRSFFTDASTLNSIYATDKVATWSTIPAGGIIETTSSSEGGPLREHLIGADADGARTARLLTPTTVQVVDGSGDLIETIDIIPGRGPLQSLDISADGSQLVFSSTTGEAVWYELDGVEAAVILGDGEGYDAQFLPDGRILAVGKGGIRMLDPRQPNRSETLEIGRDGVRVALAPSGKLIVTVNADRSVQLWDVDRRQPLGSPFTASTAETPGVIGFDGNERMLQRGEGTTTEVVLAVEAWRDAACSLLATVELDEVVTSELFALDLEEPC